MDIAISGLVLLAVLVAGAWVVTTFIQWLAEEGYWGGASAHAG